ncbi:uncharacterized protein BX664DRAFT_329986 [Halteromyces radiatus]|uniref:uncharacterized protein n=1 Tax=Halteromyces radiatus TaxID=101107 RepID=UPI002220B1F3|nr:uncharacterized protein BX664DRAFT_329986 [Halteromyces radiatus]KAI8093565.1 hypothetical protein BX664DRAFT_329986 [Halteromyces radiatus]
MASSSQSIEPQKDDTFSQDIKALLGPVIMDMDKNIIATQQSQHDFGQEIERLIAELEVFTDIADPPKLQTSLEKLVDAKKKLNNSIKLLHQTNTRLERMEQSMNTSI